LSIILTLSVLVTWLAFAAAFCALGGLMFDRVGRVEPSWEHLYYSIFAGIALTMAGLLVWHFLFPISAALGPFTVAAIVAIAVERRWFRPLMQIPAHLPFALGALALAAWTANHSLAGGGMDDYNYEFQAVRWFFEHPIVPGLANLHGRLGFNNSHHLLAALMSAGYWVGHVNHLVNGLIVSLVLVYVLFALVKIAAPAEPSQARWLFAAILFAPAIGLVLFGIFGPAISTLKADVFVTAGIILLSCVFLRFADAAANTQQYDVTAATAILVACLLTTVKLSAAAFCAVVVLAVVARVVRDARHSRRDARTRRLIGAAGAAGALLVFGFLARGIVLSGYPLYPSSALGVDVDWRVPLAQVNADRVFIKTWSQLRPTYDSAQAAGQDWVRGWLNSLILTQKLSIVLPLVLMAMLGGATVNRGRDGLSDESDEKHSRSRFLWGLPVLWAASVLALIVWWTQAPAARFAAVYFWIPLACAITAIAQTGKPESGRRRVLGATLACAALAVFLVQMLLEYSNVEALHRPGVFAVVVFGALWAIAFLLAPQRSRMLAALGIVLAVSQIGERAAAHALRGRLDDIRSMAWYDVEMLPAEPAFAHSVRQTKSGLTVYVSKSASFRTPIPNTRYFNPHLELRVPDDLRSGFRNRADAPAGYGYEVEYVIQPNAGVEIVVPAGE
jgi:hypothetical protein